MGWLQVVAALAAAAVASANAETSAPVDTAVAEQIALEKERYERVTVPVTIGGVGPFRFMVDTGAQATALSTALAARLGLDERRQATLIGAASRQEVEIADVPGFEIGGRRFDILGAPLLEAENIGADGILGLDSLQNQRVLLDFAGRRILVDDAEELGGNRGYEIVVKARRRLGQLIITGARINGVKTDVLIDTGSQDSLGNLALLDKLRRARALDDNVMTDVNGQQMATRVRICRSFEIDGMTMTDVPVHFARSPTFEALGLDEQPALILGMNELRAFRRVAIDFPARKVLFDLPRGAVRPNEIFTSASLMRGT